MLEKDPDKTFIGKIERWFDFLGYRFGVAVLTPAKGNDPKLRRSYDPARIPDAMSLEVAASFPIQALTALPAAPADAVAYAGRTTTFVLTGVRE
jgi:hypothetical protein